MTLDLDLGVDLEITDDPTAAAAPTATDTGFLIQATTLTGAPATGVSTLKNMAQGRAVFAGDPSMLASTDGFFGVGGGQLYVLPLGADVATALAMITPQMGPGQIMAPAVQTEADQQAIRDFAWNTNRIYIADGVDGETQAQLETRAETLISTNGRNSMLEADTLLIPGLAPSSTREVRASVVTAALMARSDRVTGNPNLAAAGNHTPGAAGQSDYVVGIKAERSFVEIQDLARAQVNAYRTVNRKVRNYGYWTLADLEVLPHWWDMSGSRLMMAVRAEEQAAAEELMFGQVAADGLFLDKYQGALSGVLAKYQRIGAIYGNAEKPGYTVGVSSTQNPLDQLALGKVKAQILLKSSPFAAELGLTITRRSIVDSVA